MEVWKDIVDFPNYQISNLGNIKSLKRKMILKARPVKKKNNYICYDVCLYNNTQALGFHKKIHRLVAEAFIPNPENKSEIDHIDRNPSNNNVNNLRWATKSENMLNIGIRSDNTSGEKNVYFCKQKNKWTIKQMIDGKETSYGFYNTKEEAIKAKKTGNYNLLVSNTGQKYISIQKNQYVFEKTTNGIKYRKACKTIEEAIKARDDYLNDNNIIN